MDADHEKAMWLETMMELNCRTEPTWLSCDDWREKAFTLKALGNDGRVSQLDYILCTGAQKQKAKTQSRNVGGKDGDQSARKTRQRSI